VLVTENGHEILTLRAEEREASTLG